MTGARRAMSGPADASLPIRRARHAIAAVPANPLRHVVIAVAAVLAMGSGLSAAAAPTTTLDDAASLAVVGAEPTLAVRADDGITLSRGAAREPLADAPTPETSAAPTPTPAAPAPPAEPPAPAEPAPTQSTRYATVTLNVRSEPSPAASLVGQIAAGAAVTAVGDPSGDWQQVRYDEAVAYVSAQYLVDTKPNPAPTKTATATTKARVAASGGYPACPSGSGVESGLTSRAISLHRAVCATFPSITDFGGWRADGEHSDGRALDVMASGASGRAVAEWARANASALGIQTVIYQQQIWTTQRASEGWRAMPDRGSATANHYDHVHIQVS